MLNLSNWSNASVLINYHKTLPATPGIYVFMDSRCVPAYVGQAVNLRDRHKNHEVLGRAVGAGVQIRTVCWQEHNSEESLCELECAAYSFLTKQGGCYLNIADPCKFREVATPYMGPNADLKGLLERYTRVRHNQRELESVIEDLSQMLLNYARSGVWDGRSLVSESGYRLSLIHEKSKDWLIAPPDDLAALYREQQEAKAKVKYLEEQVNEYHKMCIESGWVEVVKQPKSLSVVKVQ